MSLPRRATRAIAESPLPDWVGDAQQLLYRPLMPWAQRSPLHTDALGHSLHPALTDLTLGCWTSATLLDLLGGPSSRHAATLLTAAGIAAAIPTAVAGAADWAQTTGDERRVGAVHALGADTATLLWVASLAARLRGHYRAAARLGIGANTIMTGAGFLGGYLCSTAAPPAARSAADQHSGESPWPATSPSSSRLSHASSSIAPCPVRVTRGSALSRQRRYPRVPHTAAC